MKLGGVVNWKLVIGNDRSQALGIPLTPVATR
jgi:hypothetical protein